MNAVYCPPLSLPTPFTSVTPLSAISRSFFFFWWPLLFFHGCHSAFRFQLTLHTRMFCSTIYSFLLTSTIYSPNWFILAVRASSLTHPFLRHFFSNLFYLFLSSAISISPDSYILFLSRSLAWSLTGRFSLTLFSLTLLPKNTHSLTSHSFTSQSPFHHPHWPQLNKNKKNPRKE